MEPRRRRPTQGRDDSLAALAAWFWGRVERGRDCWRWPTAGYGRAYLGGGKRHALQVSPHRLAWMLTAGSIPEGLVICHACDTPNCVRPTHLFVGTQRDNIRDARDKGRLFPPQGERNGHARLTAATVRAIREAVAAGVRPSRVARLHRIAPSHVTMIVKRQHWAHLK